jgi:CheY-like chemotaxis protein
MAMIHRNVEVESRLIDDLLDLTRANTGRLTLDIALVDAHDIIQLAAEVCRADLKNSRLEILLELRAVNHHVNADAARLQQVFWNLIQNAVKFTPPGGRITIRTHNRPGSDPGDDQVTFSAEVADTGIGIDLERLPRIFTAFEQRDPVQRRRYGGLGLGLAISRSVVEAHGGRLTGNSAGTDKGAVFTLTLAAHCGPVPESVATDAPSSSLLDSRTQLEGLRILLIEDNPDTLRYVALLLRKRGHVVTTAQDFHTARNFATLAVFDLIISDIELPDGSGLEIIRELNQFRPTPAIALTGFGSVDDVLLCRDAGFAEHLTKPIDVRELDAAIARAAARPGADVPSVMPPSDALKTRARMFRTRAGEDLTVSGCSL